MKTLLAFILGAIVTGLATVSYDEHRVAPVPLVQAKLLTGVQAPMLFSPCPVMKRNFRTYEERKA